MQRAQLEDVARRRWQQRHNLKLQAAQGGEACESGHNGSCATATGAVVASQKRVIQSSKSLNAQDRQKLQRLFELQNRIESFQVVEEVPAVLLLHGTQTCDNLADGTSRLVRIGSTLATRGRLLYGCRRHLGPNRQAPQTWPQHQQSEDASGQRSRPRFTENADAQRRQCARPRSRALRACAGINAAAAAVQKVAEELQLVENHLLRHTQLLQAEHRHFEQALRIRILNGHVHHIHAAHGVADGHAHRAEHMLGRAAPQDCRGCRGP